MTGRDAERFARALDEGAGDDRLVALAHRVGVLEVEGPRPAARAAALAAFGGGALAASHQAASHGLLHAIAHGTALKAVTAVAALAVAGTSVGVAAHRSLPGQPFYGVKRATESVQLHLAGGGSSGARARVAQAHTRLEEIRALAGEPPSAARDARLAALVRALDADVARATSPLLSAGGADLALLQAQAAGLARGLGALPTDAQLPVVVRAQRLLAALGPATAAVDTRPEPLPSVAPPAPPTSSGPPATTPSTPAASAPARTTPTAPPPTTPALPTRTPAPRATGGAPSTAAAPQALPSAVASIVGGLLGS